MLDSDYLDRLDLLFELTQKSPEKPVRKLQRECLKYYPLHHKESIKAWLSIKTAFKCFEIHCPLHRQIIGGDA